MSIHFRREVVKIQSGGYEHILSTLLFRCCSEVASKISVKSYW